MWIKKTVRRRKKLQRRSQMWRKQKTRIMQKRDKSAWFPQTNKIFPKQKHNWEQKCNYWSKIFQNRIRTYEQISSPKGRITQKKQCRPSFERAQWEKELIDLLTSINFTQINEFLWIMNKFIIKFWVKGISFLTLLAPHFIFHRIDQNRWTGLDIWMDLL